MTKVNGTFGSSGGCNINPFSFVLQRYSTATNNSRNPPSSGWNFLFRHKKRSSRSWVYYESGEWSFRVSVSIRVDHRVFCFSCSFALNTSFVLLTLCDWFIFFPFLFVLRTMLLTIFFVPVASNRLQVHQYLHQDVLLTHWRLPRNFSWDFLLIIAFSSSCFCVTFFMLFIMFCSCGMFRVLFYILFSRFHVSFF